MGFGEFLIKRADDMLELGLAHAAVVAAAVLISTILGVGLGILTYQHERAREAVLAVTGSFLTIPSFALFILLLGPLGLGWRPVLFALVLYGLMPIVRNTITGLREFDPAIVESAKGMGYTRRQRLLRIELPLAWPVIITGVRVTSLILLGIAAIGAIVNGPGYGELIFTGLARVGTPVALSMVLAGAVGVMVLAVIFDIVFYAVRHLTTSRGIR
jgi:osmoprotectant transport system permease protein